MRTAEYLLDVIKLTKVIDDEVDTFLVSLLHNNPKVRAIAKTSYQKKTRITKVLASELTKKYGY